MSNKNSQTLLVNETFIVDKSIHDEWLDWFINTYIKAIKKSGFIEDFILSKMEDDNPDGSTYAFQFKIKKQDFPDFQNEKVLVNLRSNHNKKFINKHASFVTVLKIIAD